MHTMQIKTIRTTFPDGSVFVIVDNSGEFTHYASVGPFPGGQAIHFMNRIEGHEEVSEDDKRLFNSMLEDLEKMQYKTVGVIDPWKEKKSFSLLGHGRGKENQTA